MKALTKGIIALIVAIFMILGGSLLLSFNLVVPFAITLMALGVVSSIVVAVSLPFMGEFWGGR